MKGTSSLLLLFCFGAALPSAANPETNPVRFEFRLPHSASFQLDQTQLESAGPTPGWLKAWPEDGSTNFVELSSRLVLQVRAPDDLQTLTKGHPLAISRTVQANLFVLQAPDALTAAREAHRLAALPQVSACYPVLRKATGLDGPYAPMPTDSVFTDPMFNNLRWPLENRNGAGTAIGVDLNVRAAWPFSTGQGVTIAFADTGIETNHVELAASVAGAPHYNFAAQNGDGTPVSPYSSGAHGTIAAGLAVAQMNNARMVGVAPGAKLASWVIYTTNFHIATDEQLMDMYQYASNVVSVQNHSWGHPANDVTLSGPSLLEQVGISNAITRGRSGRGSIMVRSGGNDRLSGHNANDDGYTSDPRVISVAAIRLDGRAATYSDPGACLLVGAPSGDLTYQPNPNGLFSTDLIGPSRGLNQISFPPPYEDLSDYVFNFLGANGTSASAAEISGVAALLLSANPTLTYRDVQQILILASRHFYLADPDLVSNGAGFVVSHNDGFGVPDSGFAVNLAKRWVNRPPATNITFTAANTTEIPDDGLRVLVSGSSVPTNLASIRSLAGFGPHADTPTPSLRLVDFGFGTNTAGYNLTNKGALIERGTNTALFASQITSAAQVGAAFAIIYNFLTNDTGSGAPGGDQLIPLAETDYVPIPAVFIGNTAGEGLKALFQTNNNALAQIHLNTTSYVFTVTNTLICEHVGLRVMTDHPLRGDVRITLVSPLGTRSILQRFNADETPGPFDWTYYSTHHFYESTAGNWTAYFSDEYEGNVGKVLEVSLLLEGVPIFDTDKDGLDDIWELVHTACVTFGPKDDPDHDGYSNAFEQILGTDPDKIDVPFKLDLSRWTSTIARLSWPGSSNFTYQIWGGTNITAPVLLTNIPGHFPETEWFTPYTASSQFFRVRATPVP